MKRMGILLAGLALVTLSAGCGGGATEESAGSPEAPASSAPATSAPATPTPEARPSERPPLKFYENFGTFEPVENSGAGDSLVRVFGDDGGPPAVAVTASHRGESKFVIKSQGDESYLTDLLVNTVRDYQGTTFLEAGDFVRLQITADGSWNVTVRPIADLEEVSTPFEGKGDAVVLYSGPADEWKISHKGESNFVVKQLSEDGDDLLVNKTGDYSGTVPVSGGPSIVVINADGGWTFD